jgi:hypothetical protein
MVSIPKFNLAAVLKPLFQVKSLAVVPEPEFTPFDLSQLRDLPRETERAATTAGRGVRPNAAGRPTVYPPAVPFNYPNS